MGSMRNRAVIALATLGFLCGSTALAQTENYPNRPVRIIADSAAGSTPDVVLRLIADRLGQIWRQQVLVVNQPGAGGSIAARAAAEAPPDGYTLYQPVLSTFASLPKAAPNLPLKVPRDFLAIGFGAENPMFVAVTPSFAVASMAELIAQAKANPGKISYAVTGVGRLTHLAGELLQVTAGITLQVVPYTGGPAHAIGDVIAGRVHFIIEGYSGIAGAIQSGAIKPIAMAAPQRLAEFPDLPAVAETIPGFAATGWQVLVAPLGTSPEIIRKVSADLRAAVTDPEVRKKAAARGSYTRAMSPQETEAFIAAEQARWQPLLDRMGAKGN
jgi:tripartite-type tricarboxylate transporter receptor subunit TctC